MAHYICKGKDCKSISDRPTICLEPGCFHRYKLLDECSCNDRGSHAKGKSHHHECEAAINPFMMGVSVGAIIGTYLLLLGLAAVYLGWGQELIASFSVIYVGYEPTLMGIFAGVLWGFVDGFVFGTLMAWTYNAIHRMRRHRFSR